MRLNNSWILNRNLRCTKIKWAITENGCYNRIKLVWRKVVSRSMQDDDSEWILWVRSVCMCGGGLGRARRNTADNTNHSSGHYNFFRAKFTRRIIKAPPRRPEHWILCDWIYSAIDCVSVLRVQIGHSKIVPGVWNYPHAIYRYRS